MPKKGRKEREGRDDGGGGVALWKNLDSGGAGYHRDRPPKENTDTTTATTGGTDERLLGKAEKGTNDADDGPRRACRCTIPPAPPFAAAACEKFGFAQVVRCGDIVWVSGTVGVDDRGRLVRGGVRAQTRRAFANLEASLRAAGCDGGLSDIVDLTAVVVDVLRNGEGFAAERARSMPHGAFASMAYGVDALLMPGALVEVKCTAIVGRCPRP
jgi:enamine deaminase RidA (YjgF/YER057c/UK114 family)